MGMYDEVILDVSCPVCGNYIGHPFQTKDMECMLDTYQPGDVVDSRRLKSICVYTTCVHHMELDEPVIEGMLSTKNTGVWIEFKIPVVDGIIARDQNTWVLKDITETSYNGLSSIPRGFTFEDIVLRMIRANKRRAKDILITGFKQTNMEANKSP